MSRKFVVGLSALLASTALAHADVIGINMSDYVPSGNDSTTNDTVGQEFSINSAVDLTGFGMLMNLPDLEGTNSEAEGAEVGLWNVTTGNSLVTETDIIPGSAVLNGYFYTTEVTPIALTVGDTYIVADIALEQGNGGIMETSEQPLSVDPALTFVASVSDPNYDDSLTFPTNIAEGDGDGEFGATLLVQDETMPVHEASSIADVAAGLGMLGIIQWRRRKSKKPLREIGVKRFVADERGISSIEYAMLAVGIALAILAGAQFLGNQINAGLSTIGTDVTNDI